MEILLEWNLCLQSSCVTTSLLVFRHFSSLTVGIFCLGESLNILSIELHYANSLFNSYLIRRKGISQHIELNKGWHSSPGRQWEFWN